MKYPFGGRVPPLSIGAVHATIQRALASAGLDTTSGPMQQVTETLRRALAPIGSVLAAHTPAPDESVIDVPARIVATDSVPDEGHTDPEVPQRGRLVARQFSNDAGTRSYKVYVPRSAADRPMPMLVMLHGCTQSADDFAAGTQMNRHAEEHGFLVVYPEQSSHANPSRCWSWFKGQDQERDAGEPSLIAGIVREVAERHGADRRRVFVAGLSAGAAMAVILGETYPELFAAVGAHSGLPYRSAHDVPSALAAMKGGRGAAEGAGESGASGRCHKAVQAIPTIVFHGDRDHTVRSSNGAEIIRQAVEAHAAARRHEPELVERTERHTGPGGRSYSRTVHVDPAGVTHLESWTLHGASHAWSGGHASGSYTDGAGPDASAEMVRFFLSLPRDGSA